jgi:hypothetical protein
MREILGEMDFMEPAPSDDLLKRMESFSEAYRRDGVIRIPGALDKENLAIARGLFDWSRAHPSESGWNPDMQGDGETAFIDTHNRAARSLYSEILRKSDIPAIAAMVMGVDRLWFLGEQLFIKHGRKGSSATPWHQDSDLLIDATGAMGMWMAFESLDVESGLSFIRGSHLGPCYNPLVPAEDGGPPRFLYPKNLDLEPFPDIDADRGKFDIVTFPYEPGDVILFHHLTIHGGAPVPAGGRNTLCLRFVGPDVLYDDRREREPNGNVGVEATQYLWEGLERDMPLHRGTHFVKVYDKTAPAA